MAVLTLAVLNAIFAIELCAADAQAAAYHLDLEVLRDDRRGVRLWDLFFRHRFDRAENFDDKEIFDVITKAFSPAQEGGRVRAKDAREIVQDIRKGLDREAGNSADAARCLLGLGVVRFRADGDLNGAEVVFQEALGIFAHLDDGRAIVDSLGWLAILERRRGNFAGGRDLQRQALATSRGIGHRFGEMMALNSIGDASRLLAESEEAERCYRESLAIARSTGSSRPRAANSSSRNSTGRAGRAVDRAMSVTACDTRRRSQRA